MNNSEILEIKKRLKKDSHNPIRICGCYVAGEEKKKLTYINSYLDNLPDEEQHKYIEILRKALSGAIGRNLLNLDFTEEAVQEGGIQQSLLGLRDSELKDEAMLEVFYDYIIEKFSFVGNYLILLMSDCYDVPVKTNDKRALDESTEVFNYILCCLCPVNLSKSGLSYHSETNQIQNRLRDWVVDMPCNGFMFPCFNDRSADIHSLLYYVKSASQMHNELITEALGCNEKLTGSMQKEIFKEIVEEALSTEIGSDMVEIIKNINDNLTEMVEQNTTDEPIMLDKEDVTDLLIRSGVNENQTEAIERAFIGTLGETAELNANQIKDDKSFEVKTGSVAVKVKADDADRIKVQMVDGRKCLVVPIDDDIEVNGIMSRIRQELTKAE